MGHTGTPKTCEICGETWCPGCDTKCPRTERHAEIIITRLSEPVVRDESLLMFYRMRFADRDDYDYGDDAAWVAAVHAALAAVKETQ